MAGERPGRGYGELRGASQEINEVASELRSWMKAAGLTLKGLRERLTTDHFSDGNIPSQSTVSNRLQGRGLEDDWPFIEAVADTCSTSNTERERRLKSLRPTWEKARRAPTSLAPDQPGAGAQEVARLQEFTVETSRRLAQAWDRVAELEETRRGAEKLAIFLLGMVVILTHQVDKLTEQRERVGPYDETGLAALEERLARSEGQRDRAETELARARAEQDRAERLAAQARARAAALEEELDALRPHDPSETTGPASDLALPDDQPGEDAGAEVIDQVLRQVAERIDDGTRHLDHLAEEMAAESPLDNPPTSVDTMDNESVKLAGVRVHIPAWPPPVTADEASGDQDVDAPKQRIPPMPTIGPTPVPPSQRTAPGILKWWLATTLLISLLAGVIAWEVAGIDSDPPDGRAESQEPSGTPSGKHTADASKAKGKPSPLPTHSDDQVADIGDTVINTAAILELPDCNKNPSWSIKWDMARDPEPLVLGGKADFHMTLRNSSKPCRFDLGRRALPFSVTASTGSIQEELWSSEDCAGADAPHRWARLESGHPLEVVFHWNFKRHLFHEIDPDMCYENVTSTFKESGHTYSYTVRTDSLPGTADVGAPFEVKEP